MTKIKKGIKNACVIEQAIRALGFQGHLIAEDENSLHFARHILRYENEDTLAEKARATRGRFCGRRRGSI